MVRCHAGVRKKRFRYGQAGYGKEEKEWLYR